MMKVIWRVEVRGRGVQPYEFLSKAEADLFAGATFPWQGLAWRVFKQVVKVEAK